ncbi:MAG TPA: circularly permuted type 2 ATP-grasp protein, partial [Vicinamibacteria bacterium]|nr:circularly permuted type 2 ATP-grasp protein [Vicinamibacteria bacterium]
MQWVAAPAAFDEVFAPDGTPRPHYRPLVASLDGFAPGEIERRERLQRLSLVDQGITFTVYGETEGVERIFPFDFVPRIIPATEWERIQAGLVQRVTALNLFILDMYQGQACLRDGVVPAPLALSRREYKRELRGVLPPRRIYTHVVGTDLIRDAEGRYLVLEDNC